MGLGRIEKTERSDQSAEVIKRLSTENKELQEVIVAVAEFIGKVDAAAKKD